MNRTLALTPRPSTSTPATIGPPANAHAALLDALDKALAALDDRSLSSATLASGQIVGLRSRMNSLTAAMAPCTRPRIAAILASLDGMAARTAGDADMAKALMLQDVEDLDGVSEWALVASARAFRRGDIGSAHWRPTAGELRVDALRRETSYRREMHRLSRVLDAPELTAPPRVRISPDRFKELSAELGSWVGHDADRCGD